MSSTGHCVPSTTAAGRDGAGVSLSGKTGISSVDSSEEDGVDSSEDDGEDGDDEEEDGEEDEEEDDDDEDEDDSTRGQCNDSDDESDSVASESASVSILSLSTRGQCSDDDAESNEVSICVTEDGADDDGVRRTVGDITIEESAGITADASGDVATMRSISVS